MKLLFSMSCVLLASLASCGELEKEEVIGDRALVPVNVQNIFDDHCAFSGCHAGGSPQEGLNLSEVSAYENLVNVNSSKQPSVKRVLPGQPDNSYLIRKLEGAAGIDGDRMPADGPPYLTTAQIDTIRLWITNGALAR